VSGNKLIDDYLSDLMDDPPAPPAAASAPADAAAGDSGASDIANATGPVPNEPDAEATDDHIASAGSDPLAAFRTGADDISEDEFEAMLDALKGKPPATPASPAAPAEDAAAGADADPLAAFRSGSAEIGEDEFEAMLDVLEGKAPPPDAPLLSAETAAANPPARPRAAQVSPPPPVPLPAAREPDPPPRSLAVSPRVIEQLLPPAPRMSPEPQGERRRRRAEERVASWLRFGLGRQHFAVEVLKVQEVLRVPMILPVRGTEPAMLGVMNLRGQIVPVLDLAAKLGFPSVEPTDASRVIVLEERGDTLGLLVAAVADVANVSDARIEPIGGTTSLVAADVVRGIARRESNIIILLDASKLLG
jgi:purine-binding chemotaxis protein CheW